MVIGSVIEFGHIRWRVLDVRKDTALVISEKILETRAFNEEFNSITTWGNCSMRQYLNGEFLSTFGEDDRKNIIEKEVGNRGNHWYEIENEEDTNDKVFLLSIEEADMYFGNSYDYINEIGHYYSLSKDDYVKGDFMTHITNDHDSKRIARDEHDWAGWWWLRTTGEDHTSIALVDSNGRIDVEGQILNTIGGMRPAMWINLQEGMREKMSEASGKTSQILSKMNGLAGLAEFKAYMYELDKVRPYISKWAKRLDFPIQHFLFAVDPGNGCSTAAELLHEYLNETELYGKHPSNYKSFGLKEMEFKRFHDDNRDIYTTEYMKNLPDEIKSAASGVLVLNIEDWLNHLEADIFADMLDICWEMRNQITFIFTVPYLDEGVLTRVHARLEDIMNVRLMHFHPYTEEELINALKNHLQEFDIRIDDSALPFIKHLLTEERNDRRFYGMQTISKLGTELVLAKARNASLNLNDAPSDMLTSDDFYIADVEENEKPASEQLDELIGLEEVKKRVYELIATFKVDKQFAEKDSAPPSFHMVFTGSPGTGKTTVARIIGKMFRESGLLRIGDLLEVNRFDLVGEFIGQTGPKTVERCRAAFGSILFIDEAYSLGQGSEDNTRDFGREALVALVAEMENNRDKFVVIMAGYEDDMDTMFKVNSGLRSRIPHSLHFPNYSRDELFEIFKMQVSKKHECDDEVFDKVKEYFAGLSNEYMESKEFGNARFVRNLVERLRIKALLRLQSDITSMPAGQKLPLIATDLESAISDEDLSRANQKDKRRRIGFYADAGKGV